MRRYPLGPWLALASPLFACAKGEGGGNPFDAPDSAAVSLTAADDPQSHDDGSDNESSSEDGDAATSTTALAESSESTADPTADPTVDPTAEPGGESESSGDTADAEPGAQPAEGMYSACAAPSDCVGVNLCVTIVDAMQVPLGGFCTAPGCANAAVDCIAAPGGTATPMCMPLTVDGMPDSACALDCAGGKTCPGGMECIAVTGGSICA